MSSRYPTPPSEPPGFTPPGGDDRTSSRKGVWVPVLFMLLVLLVLSAVWVVWFLPGHISNKEKGLSEKVHGSMTPEGDERAGGHSESQALEAERRWIEVSVKAQAERLPEWGQAEWKDALATSRQAAGFLAEGDYRRAVSGFDKAVSMINEMLEKRQLVLTKALDAGDAAIMAGNGTAAARYYSQALAIDPANSRAELGIKRAGSAKSVHDMLCRAIEMVNQHDCTGAVSLLEKIISIDPATGKAKELLAGCKESLKKEEFDILMGKAMSFLARGDFHNASGAAARARALYPESASASELSEAIKSAEKESRIRRLLRMASECEKNEDWQQALALYGRAAEESTGSVEANAGLQRVKRRLGMVEKLRRIITDPDRLQEQPVLQEAIRLISAARKERPRGPEYTGLIAQAASVVELARETFPVRFISDGKTDVVVYHVGKLGLFTQRVLSLRPGYYTAVGTRDGYVDTRVGFRVRPSKGAEVEVVVRCRQKI